MLNKPGASAIITTAKPRVLWIAKMFGDDDCFLIVVAFLKALVGKSRVYSLSLSSFPKVAVGNPLLSIRLTLFVITTDPRQKHSGMTLAFAFCLSSFPKEWPPAGLGNLLFVVAVILESRSPGSVVIKQGINSGTLRAGSWRAACSPLG